MQHPGSKQRIEGYDLARALAVFGMVIVNFKTVMHTSTDSDAGWLAVFNLLDGRASAIFVVLAGVGISLLSQRARQAGDPALLRQARRGVFRRAAWLFVIGLAYVGIWPADILHYYGVYLAVGALLLAWPTRALCWLAGGVMAAFAVLFCFFDYTTAWQWATLSYAGFWSWQGFLRNLLFNGFHPVLPWVAFLIAGMALGRLPMHVARVRQRVFWYGVAATLLAETLAFGIRSTLAAAGYAPELLHYLFATTPMPPLPLYMVSALGSACAVIALCVHVAQPHPGAAWLRPLTDVGQLSLTIYVAHVVIGMGALEALGLLTQQPLTVAVCSALAFCGVTVLFARLWQARFRQGPLEWLLKKASAGA